MATRMFYGLQQVTVGGNTLGGVQSVGVSSTTNIENFSKFGDVTDTATKLQDLDLEITIENALGSDWTNGLNAYGFSSINANAFGAVTVVIQYLTAASTTATLSLSAILSSYSVQMGLDGPATESLTFVNDGNAVFSTGAGTALGTGGTACKVITRPDFTSFTYTDTDYGSDCTAGTVGTTTTLSNVQSVSASMDISTEKVNILGQSLSFGKYVTFPIESSMEAEYHVDPSATMPALVIPEKTTSGTSLKDIVYATTITLPGNTYSIGAARLTGASRSGGDVGGGAVTDNVSFSGLNDFSYA